MNKIDLKYGVDDIPPVFDFVLFSLQWLIISVPILVIIGRVAAGLHDASQTGQISYLQKVFFVTAMAFLFQVLGGHRLPLVIGPSSVLLVGLLAARGASSNAINSSIFLGGVVVSLVSVSGIFGYLKRFFTLRVVAAILLLIPFTLAPTIINLIVSAPAGAANPVFNFFFALGLTLAMLVANRYLTGMWKATLIMWSMLVASVLYFAVFPQQLILSGQPGKVGLATSFLVTITGFSFNPGLFISFLLCFLALVINDLGSI